MADTVKSTDVPNAHGIIVLNPDGTSISGSGGATSAKQDALLAELQLKADLTETQPVSLASVPSHNVTNVGTFAVQVTSAPTTAVTGTFWQATQPVSGSVTANAGTNLNTSALALESTLTSLLLEIQVLNGAIAQQTDDTGTGTIYQGWAAPGTATSAASWRIRKVVETSSDFSMTMADGNSNFDNIWDNRASLSYS